MADKISTLADQLAGAIKESDSRKTAAYDTPATVRRIDGSTAWVHIPGGVDETPVQLTVAASAGDTVQVRVSGGTAWIVGNASAPPTDDKAAQAAQETADVAVTEAEAASEMSTEARQVARAAAKIAGDTEQHFWFTETGADTGAHITEKTQEDFLADPDNGGGNLLARSNGIAVRDGLVELGQFSGDGVRLYADGVKVFDASASGALKTIEIHDHPFDGVIQAEESETIVSTVKSPVGEIRAIVNMKNNIGWAETDFTAGTAGSDTSTLPGLGIAWDYDGEETVTTTMTAPPGGGGPFEVIIIHSELAHAPFIAGGTRAGTPGAFSATFGESLYARDNNRFAAGAYNKKYGDNEYEPLFSIGNGTADDNRSNAFEVDSDGFITAGSSATMEYALTEMGWWNYVKDGYYNASITKILERILGFVAAIDMPLVTSANWTSGTLSVPGSSKYRVFEVVQGGAAVVAFRYGNSIRGFALSGNASSGNYNQYIRAFGASVNWTTEVWTMEWAKQLSHVTSSGYHTSGTEQAITEIRGLIPLRGAFIE